MSNVDTQILAAINGENGEAQKAGTRKCLMNRRQFLLTSGIATSVVMVGIPGLPEAQTPAAISTYPRKRVGKLSELQVDEPFDFEYPDEGQYAESILVKLGREAGGGIGPDKDVVAFNYTCTHQGGPLQGTYQAADKALGPCPLHLTTFDLTRHGIFISGQAYQSLPQVLLELDGDDIYAVGMFGLIYGRFDNLQG
ncbi:arsenate reductase (azurin) small subunit [Thalassococcus sp. S3]|uniref:arsenate reductase (azurin) small subunit n=1 Tax=Thalassococcus sp. S3 TaxID=2017482 RepID=UPI0010246309|nr:arsenate reductase (azurin) small subunit [Thalassococcus sp. S3]QBF32516.1 arsenate reductase (azurin) small subunit [Thalassococcus sp. S3]